MAEVSKYCDKIVAEQKGVKAEVKVAAENVAAHARRELAAHRDTGASKITVTRGKIDSFANLDDENAGAIEWGDLHPDGRPIPGLHIMARAAGVRY